jgi:hypothetical protein
MAEYRAISSHPLAVVFACLVSRRTGRAGEFIVGCDMDKITLTIGLIVVPY